ncbi:hypothetical protein [Kutzneria sp. NPDC052558]|uniref:hypothetical protein n=1 Tax=Kutzneria sp. NPDC052558 TaxID=3364121 RepID=UPI0037C6E9D3
MRIVSLLTASEITERMDSREISETVHHGSGIYTLDTDLLLLMPCGFPPAKTEQELKRLKGFDAADRRYIVDGPAYFNRPGPRVVDGVELLAELFHGVEAES